MSSGFHDNSANVIDSVNGAMKKALVKIGEAASELIQDKMDLGYGRPIWLTGDLHRDVQYKYDSASGTVMVGNSL